MASSQFGEYLKELRTSKRMGLNVLAEESKVSSALISRVENGSLKIPKIENLNKLAKGLGVSNAELHYMAGHKLSRETLRNLTLSKAAIRHTSEENLNNLEEIKSERGRTIKVTIEDPKLRSWYIGLQKIPETELKKLHQVWQIYQKSETEN